MIGNLSYLWDMFLDPWKLLTQNWSLQKGPGGLGRWEWLYCIGTDTAFWNGIQGYILSKDHKNDILLLNKWEVLCKLTYTANYT